MSNRITVTDYVVKVDKEPIQAKDSLGEARRYVEAMGVNLASSNELPDIIEIVKRTTTQTVKDIYRPKQVNTLVAESLDADFGKEL